MTARQGGAHLLLSAIEEETWYSGQIAHVHLDEAAEPRYRTPASAMPGPLASYLEQGEIQLYTHQADAFDAFGEGRDVVLATSTASGKSLAFNMCVAKALLADPAATALYLYPTKALSNDQLGRLRELDAALGLCSSPATYDGDTPSSARARIRRESRIIVSNPYGLHEYLAQPLALQQFLSRLAVVVVDEAHRYRGVFGSHVALVLRRLVRLAERFGGRPRFVLASGTIANPGEHGHDLVGRQVEVIDDDGSARPARSVVLWDSMADPAQGALSQAARLVTFLVGHDQSTICFAGSRVGVELVANWAAEAMPARRVSAYRAGYRPSERREIESELREGHLDAVVATDALELGVDIGALDAAVLAGYPGTVASTWQQLGRAGRSQRPSLGILVAGDDALDQYLVRRPSLVFGAPVERAVVVLENPEVLAGQVLCAASEMAVREDEDIFGPELPHVIAGLHSERLLAPAPGGYMFSGSFRPASAVRIDGRGEGSVEVRVGDQLVEVLEHWRALREAHEGAVLIHRGQRYRIERLDLEEQVAYAKAVEAQEHTRSKVAREVLLGATEKTRSAGSWTATLGQVVVRTSVVGYRRVLGNEEGPLQALDLPAVELHTKGLWLTTSDLEPLGVRTGRHLLGSMHAAEHALIHSMPLLAMCDRGDAGGMSSLVHPGVEGPLLLVYDGYEGGSGIATTAFEDLSRLAALTFDLLESCGCGAEGCPKCCWSKLCGSDNQPMDRLGALQLLEGLLGTS